MEENEEIEKKEIKKDQKTIATPKSSNVMSKASGFARGAVLGGIGGFLFAMATKNKPVFWTIVGVVGGGYIGHRISQVTDTSKQVKFNFDGTKSKKRKFR